MPVPMKHFFFNLSLEKELLCPLGLIQGKEMPIRLLIKLDYFLMFRTVKG